MANQYALDTHALIWFLEGNSRLGANAQVAMQDPNNTLYLSIIALAEACWVVENGKCGIPTIQDLVTDIDADPRIVIVPLDRPILDLSCTLTTIGEMHDRMIVATALYLSNPGVAVPLITCDGNITASGLVSVIW